MAYQYTADIFDTEIDAKQRSNLVTDRTFGLPTALYTATIALYFAFLAVMAVGFQTPRMGIVIGICVLYVVMAFGVPALWTRMKPDHGSKAQDWIDFVEHGVETATGRLKAEDATAQVLILPVLIFFWGVATAVIAATIG